MLLLKVGVVMGVCAAVANRYCYLESVSLLTVGLAVTTTPTINSNNLLAATPSVSSKPILLVVALVSINTLLRGNYT